MMHSAGTTRKRNRRKPPTVRPAVGLAVLLAAAGTLSGEPATAQPVDTSEWVCEFCPFEQGHRVDYSVGASQVSDDSAYFDDATGYGEEGVVANVDGYGSYVGETHRLSWEATDIGLDSRALSLRGGRQGRFDYSLDYREIPRRQFITTDSIFVRSGGSSLGLPSGWVPSGNTGGFTQISSSLANRDIGSDRSTAGIGLRYFAREHWRFTARYRRQEQDGTDILGGAYFTTASQLPMPFVYTTDDVDIGIRYSSERGYAALNWHLSKFESDGTAFRWATPFATAPGAEMADIAQPPDNSFGQLSLTGAYRFDVASTMVRFSAAAGQIKQDAAFLPYTTNANLTTSALPRANFDGEVETGSLALFLSSRPIDGGRVQLSYRHDERDNQSPQELWERVITDTFTSNDFESNVPYSYERTTLRLSADYDLLESLRVSAGYERKDIDRDFQEVADQTEDTSWGRVRWRPGSLLELDVKGGTSKRDINRYNETFATTLGQNPLLRKYNLAYRFREFGELRLTGSLPQAPVSLTVSALLADDSYTQSQLGITAADDRRLSADLSWSVAERASLYLHGGIENIDADQSGSESFGLADWTATNDDDFYTLGAGFRVREIADRFDLSVDYLRSRGKSQIDVASASGGQSRFPELQSTFDDLRIQLSYARSERLEISASLRFQQFKAEDWSLEGVAPATLPTVLALGADPYDDDVVIAGLSVRYRIGGTNSAAGN